MPYAYLAPHEAYRNRTLIEGRVASRAYWLRPYGLEGEECASQYDFAFKTLKRIEPGLHAFRLVFADGSCEELCSYDTICVR